MKRFFILGICLVMAVVLFTGCTGKSSDGFDMTRPITVVSREDGSGTRGAFIELAGIEEKGEDGTRIDRTTKEAIVVNKTDVMLTTVAGDDYAIGYVSLGSLGNTIKALKVNGVEATADNIKNGSYTLARPFNIATKGEPEGLTKDFIDFILSQEGQQVVSESYIEVIEDGPIYRGSKPSGKIVVAGSSSVAPVMEKLIEAYREINTNAEIELQVSDSTSGMNGAIEGTCDIGMASRDLKDSEKEELLSTEIALDGIAVIVNNNNLLDHITMEEIKEIFTGKLITWEEVGNLKW